MMLYWVGCSLDVEAHVNIMLLATHMRHGLSILVECCRRAPHNRLEKYHERQKYADLEEFEGRSFKFSIYIIVKVALMHTKRISERKLYAF